jgi:hypothetical protein
MRICWRTTAHQILGNDLNMNRVCARWVPRILTAEHLTKRVELSKQLITVVKVNFSRRSPRSTQHISHISLISHQIFSQIVPFS